MTISRELADEIRAIFAVDNLPDRDEFTADMEWLNSRADYMIEVALPGCGHLFYECGPSVYDQTVADLSPIARREIRAATFGAWPA